MEQLMLQVPQMKAMLQQQTTDWKDRCSCIEQIAIAVESLENVTEYKDVVWLLRSLSDEIGLQLAENRSKHVKTVCEYLIRIVVVIGQDFQDIANALLPQILSASKSSSSAIRHPVANLLSKLSEKVRYDLAIVKNVYVLSKQEKIRVSVLEQLRIVLVYWSDEEILPWESEMSTIIQSGIRDQYENVRKAAREVLCRFSLRWSERGDELLDTMSDHGRILLVQEHRESSLAAVAMKKYPMLASKADTSTRKRDSYAQLRANFHRSSQRQSEQNIAILEPATLSPKQCEFLEKLNQIKSSSNREMTTISASTAAIEEPESAVMQRLSDNLDSAREFGDYQQYDNEVCSCSQARELYAKKEIVLPHASEICETSMPQADSYSRATVLGASGACKGEETLLQYPNIRQVEDRHSRNLPNRTPTHYRDKVQESPTRGSPVLFCEESSSLKPMSIIGLSSPVGSDHIEEDKLESNSLSPRDECFNRLIPSAMDTPARSLPSTDNVTLRPRRRQLVEQKQDNLSPRPCPSVLSSSTQLTPENSTQLRPVRATLKPDVFSNPSKQEAVSSLREQHGGCVLYDQDDNDHLPGRNDHAEPHSERDYRKLDNSRPQSKDESCLVETNDEQLELRKEDVMSDKLHRGEGLTDRCDSLNEVGDFDVIDNNEKASVNKLQVSEMISTRARDRRLLREQYSVQDEIEVKEDREEKLSTEVRPQNLLTDTLTSLQNVQEDMTRLREASCSSEFVEEGRGFAHAVFDSADISEETQEQYPSKDDTPLWKKSESVEKRMERLAHTDLLSPSSLLVPSIDGASKQPNGSSYRDQSLTISKTPKHSLYQATNDDDFGKSMETNSLSTQVFHSPLRVSEHPTARNNEPGYIDFAEKDRAECTEPLSQNLQKDVQPQGLFDADEQAKRFHAVEKLFAEKVLPTEGFYNRPQLSEPEHLMHTEPYHVRFPPTQLGAKLNPTYAKSQKKVIEEKIAIVANDVAAENVLAAVDAEMEAISVEDQTKVLRKDRQAVINRDETSKLPALNCTEHDASLTFDTASHSSAKASAVAQETNIPPAKTSWASFFSIPAVVFLAAIFGMMGFLLAAKKTHESHEYHLALKTRIGKFEASIIETHKKVLKLEEDYAIWSEYVRTLTEEDEIHALAQLEAIQVEVQKWQHDMKADLVAFRQALSVDSIEATFAGLHVNNTQAD